MVSLPGADGSRGRGRRLLRALVAAVLPPPLAPVRLGRLVPLLLVLGGGGGAVLAAVLTHHLAFAAPERWWTLLSALIAWWWWAAAGPGAARWRGLCAVTVRLLLILALVAAWAGPRMVRANDRLAVMYCLDCSDSVGEAGDARGVDWITRTAEAKPVADAAGLVVFARDAAVEIPPRPAFVYDAIASRLARDGTDIAGALALSAAALPQDQAGRIVLISDGTATAGDTERVVEQLASRHIPVDVLPVTYDHREEVWLERLELPQEVHLRETYEAGVILGSLAPGQGRLVLTENGHTIASQPVTYAAGRTRFAVPLTLRDSGYYEYAATIEPEPGHDTWRQNNTVLGAITVAGQGRVLLVHQDDAEARVWQPLAQAVRAAGHALQVITASELPEDPQALQTAEVVILVNVAADEVNQGQQLALRDAVQDLGVGLLMVGGENGFGPGGWNRSPVEEALPVTMDTNVRKVMPKGALAIILEMCEFPDGDGWAKTITKKAIRVLGAKDDVGVLTYSYGLDSGDHWIAPLQPAKDYSALAQRVDGADLGDMPSFDSILRVALTGLKENDAAAKHVLLISDGDCEPPSPELLEEYRAAGIPISTVLIVPMDDSAKQLCHRIAQVTGGRYYFPTSPSQLPAIFVKEAKTIRRSELQNVTFVPRVSFPSPILKELGPLPPLHGYTLTTAKPHAQVVLRGPDQDTEDPVLAVWRFGLGTAAAWTSDLSTNWAAAWQGWERYRAFVDQLLTALARTVTPSQLAVQVFEEGGEGVVLVEDRAATPDFLSMQARVHGPDGAEQTIAIPQIAPGRYRATFPVSSIGRYHLGIVAAGGTESAPRSEHALATLTVSYAGEYLRFRANPLVLQGIATRTGGRVLQEDTSGVELFRAGRHAVYTSRPVLDWAFALVAFLLPLDVAIRRVAIDLSVLSRLWWWRRARAAPATPTMGALLGRKAAITLPSARAELAGSGVPAPASPGAARSVPATAARPAAPATAGPPPPSPGSTPPTPDTTTGKLLEARRRRQQPP